MRNKLLHCRYGLIKGFSFSSPRIVSPPRRKELTSLFITVLAASSRPDVQPPSADRHRLIRRRSYVGCPFTLEPPAKSTNRLTQPLPPPLALFSNHLQLPSWQAPSPYPLPRHLVRKISTSTSIKEIVFILSRKITFQIHTSNE